MTIEERYINQVIDKLPRGTPLRAQIALELRSHIAECVQRGNPINDVLHQLGDPLALAESYLAALPLVSASFWSRAAAKLIDALTVLCIFAPFAWLVWRFTSSPLVGLIIPAAVLAFCGYVVVAEHWAGETLGKRLLCLRVVRESGARISLGQSLMRQLPIFLQIFWIDALFALFTEKRQRAFESISKTRVVLARIDNQRFSKPQIATPGATLSLKRQLRQYPEALASNKDEI